MNVLDRGWFMCLKQVVSIKPIQNELGCCCFLAVRLTNSPHFFGTSYTSVFLPLTMIINPAAYAVLLLSLRPHLAHGEPSAAVVSNGRETSDARREMRHTKESRSGDNPTGNFYVLEDEPSQGAILPESSMSMMDSVTTMELSMSMALVPKEDPSAGLDRGGGKAAGQTTSGKANKADKATGRTTSGKAEKAKSGKVDAESEKGAGPTTDPTDDPTNDLTGDVSALEGQPSNGTIAPKSENDDDPMASFPEDETSSIQSPTISPSIKSGDDLTEEFLFLQDESREVKSPTISPTEINSPTTSWPTYLPSLALGTDAPFIMTPLAETTSDCDPIGSRPRPPVTTRPTAKKPVATKSPRDLPGSGTASPVTSQPTPSLVTFRRGALGKDITRFGFRGDAPKKIAVCTSKYGKTDCASFSSRLYSLQ